MLDTQALYPDRRQVSGILGKVESQSKVGSYPLPGYVAEYYAFTWPLVATKDPSRGECSERKWDPCFAQRCFKQPLHQNPVF